MIDYASITPVMSMTTFLVGFIAILLIARAGVELIDIYSKKKSPQELGRVPASEQAHLSASQKAIQRYYNTYQKGA